MGTPAYGIQVWSTDAWREEATAWTDDVLEGHGIRRTGPAAQPHLRVWATALRMPTTSGDVWLKAPSPGLRFEVPMYAVLARFAPEHALAALGADEERSWVLLPDGGPVVGSIEDPHERQRVWVRTMSAYADLQQHLMQHSTEIAATGLPDHSPVHLVDRFDEALEASWTYADSDDDRDVLKQVARQRDRVTELAERLSVSPHGPTLQHDDLHQFNAFVDGPSGPRFFDWGDSVLGHPFTSMLVAQRATATFQDVSLHDPVVVAVRDAYLEAFGGPTRDNLDDLDAACRLGVITRATNWTRGLDALPTEDTTDLRSAPIRWLSYLLLDDSLGGPLA